MLLPPVPAEMPAIVPGTYPFGWPSPTFTVETVITVNLRLRGAHEATEGLELSSRMRSRCHQRKLLIPEGGGCTHPAPVQPCRKIRFSDARRPTKAVVLSATQTATRSGNPAGNSAILALLPPKNLCSLSTTRCHRLNWAAGGWWGASLSSCWWQALR